MKSERITIRFSKETKDLISQIPSGMRAKIIDGILKHTLPTLLKNLSINDLKDEESIQKFLDKHLNGEKR